MKKDTIEYYSKLENMGNEEFQPSQDTEEPDIETAEELEVQKNTLEEKYAQEEKERDALIAELQTTIESKKVSLEEAVAQIGEMKDLIELKQSETLGSIFNYLQINKLKKSIGSTKRSVEKMQTEFDDIQNMLGQLEGQVQDRSDLESIENKLSEIYTAQAEQAAIEAFEKNRETRDASNVMEKHKCIIAHGFAATDASAAVTVLRQGTTWRERLNIVMGLQPEIPCSSARTENEEQDSPMYYDIGVILKGGEIGSAHKTDAASHVSGTERTTTQTNEEVEKKIDEAINDRDPKQYNELLIKKPEIGGMFIEERILRFISTPEQTFDKRSSNGALYGESPAKVKEMLLELQAEANKRGMPLYIRGTDGSFYEATEDLFGEKARAGISRTTINKGRKITEQDILNSEFEVSEEQRREAREAIFENSPFKIKNPERSAIDEWSAAQDIHALLKKDKKKLTDRDKSTLRRFESGYIQVSYGSIVEINEPMTDLASYANGIITLLKNQQKELDEKIEYINSGRGLNYSGASKEQRIASATQWKEEYEYKYAAYAYGFAEAAKKSGDDATYEKIKAVAAQYLSEEAYNDLIARRVSADGGFRITEDDLKDISSQ